MILFLHTATPTCFLSLEFDGIVSDYQWESGRELASGLLGYLQDTIQKHAVTTQHLTLKDVTGIVAYQGPGSFTGLRIGLTVLNTLADSEGIPIVGVTGDDWKEAGKQRLAAGENDQLVMPQYGAEPHITTQRK